MEESPVELDAGFSAPVYKCFKCRGVWLDRQVVAKVSPPMAHIAENPLRVQKVAAAGRGLERCPRCQEVPWEVHFLDVEIDVCPYCGGLWLDAGEYRASTLTGADDRDRNALAYRSQKREVDGFVPCVYCGEKVHVASSMMSEGGVVCPNCHRQKEGALQAEPGALRGFLTAVSDLVQDVLGKKDRPFR